MQKFGVLLFCVVIVFFFFSIDYCCVCLIYLMCLLKLYKEKKKIYIYIYIYIHAHTSMIGLIYYINCLFFQNLFFLFFIFCVVTDNTLLTLEGTACPTLEPPQGMPSSYLIINRSSKRFLIAKAFKQDVSCLFLFMYAIGEMHQVISETYTC